MSLDSIVFMEDARSRDIVGISSLLLERSRGGKVGRSAIFEVLQATAASPLPVFAREDRVVVNRDIDDSRSKTKVLLSGSWTSTNSFGFAS